MFALEQRVHVNAERQLDGFAGSARGSDDDDATFGVRSVAVGVRIRRKVVVAGRVHGEG
jgi:hypothetical protein